MSSILTAPKGMNDVMPEGAEPFLSTAVWDKVIDTARRVIEGFGYRQVLIPLVEETALFQRGIGEGTDIVSKEMYSFTDRGERSLTLRPEGTAGCVRAFIEHGFAKTDPVQKWWYFGPMFRAERPQKGRYRQFYQIGAELYGASDPAADAEIILVMWRICEALGLKDVTPRVNTLGDTESRDRYRDVLRGYMRANVDKLCDACKGRIDTNPLRFLDCKNPSCRELAKQAPDIMESLSEASRKHFEKVTQYLRDCGLTYVRDPALVRGLDYYSETTFELTTTALGAQDAVGGGGRYDGLIEELGGTPTPAIGFAMGVERLALLVAAQQQVVNGPHLFIAPMPGAESFALQLAGEIRAGGPYRVEVDVTGRKLKSQMKRADKVGARFAIVLGEDEIARRHGNLKDLRVSSTSDVALTGEAICVALAKLVG
jgi:histidyl-tRNA synthetase